MILRIFVLFSIPLVLFTTIDAQDLHRQAQSFAEEFLKPRIARCGDSYFMLVGKNGIYQIKARPVVKVFGTINPAKPASEADRLNGKPGRPATWYGNWQIKLDRVAWRYFRFDRWDPWRDDTLTFSAQMDSFWDGGWTVHKNRDLPQVIPEHRCSGNDIDFRGNPFVGSYVDELDGSSLGGTTGIAYVPTSTGKGAMFSRQKESRIEFSNQFPEEGTLEFRIFVNFGYEYKDFKVLEHRKYALIFSSAGPDVWYPGSTWLYLYDDGTITLDMATTKYEGIKQTLVVKNTDFRFGQWHNIGISFGTSGQFVMIDGVLVGSAPQNKQILGNGGNHDTANDIPTIGEIKSGFWENNRFESGFDGTLDAYRVSSKQKDWLISTSRPKGVK